MDGEFLWQEDIVPGDTLELDWEAFTAAHELVDLEVELTLLGDDTKNTEAVFGEDFLDDYTQLVPESKKKPGQTYDRTFGDSIIGGKRIRDSQPDG